MTSETTVIVAVQRRTAAKTRLAGALEPHLRGALVAAMLDDTLAAIRGTHDGRLVVITPERDYETTVTRHDGHLLIDPGTGFADAVRAALAQPDLGASTSVLILPADLPHIRPEHVRALLDALPGTAVLLARLEDGGTAALGLHPPDVIDPAFGPQSGHLHAERARAAHATLRELDLPGLRTDVDTPEDLEAVRARVGPATRAVLEQIPGAILDVGESRA